MCHDGCRDSDDKTGRVGVLTDASMCVDARIACRAGEILVLPIGNVLHGE
jgi:hypothetical protein